jgi:hypothetical protein
MDIGIIVIWLSLSVYTFILFKRKIIEKKEWKWAFLLTFIAVGLSVLVTLNISLNEVISLLNNTFGGISRMVVNI